MSAEHTPSPIAEAFLPKRENELEAYPSVKKKHYDPQAMETMRESLIFAHTEIDQLRKKLLELLPLEERMKQKEWWAETAVQPVPMVTQAAYDDLMTEFQDMRASRDGYRDELAAHNELVEAKMAMAPESVGIDHGRELTQEEYRKLFIGEFTSDPFEQLSIGHLCCIEKSNFYSHDDRKKARKIRIRMELEQKRRDRV
jgi:hypothetical protein